MIPLTFRRLHDTGRSGWWYIVYIILSIIWNIPIFSNIFLALWRAVAANANMDDAFSGSIFSMFFPPHIIICFIMTAIYGIILLIFLCQDSQPYDNKYGPSPKYVAEGNESDIPDNVPAWEPEDRWN